MSAPTENKSYLSETISSFSPWGSRNVSPKPQRQDDKSKEQSRSSSATRGTRGGDHSVTNRHRLSLSTYPRDCPRLDVQWFHAIDVPKRKPDYVQQPPAKDTKPPVEPKKWNAFSAHDSRVIELAFQKLSEKEEREERRRSSLSMDISADLGTAGPLEDEKRAPKDPKSAHARDKHRRAVKVPVNEDYLFDVDVKNRELGPAYWVGPVYEVRRGTWFDASTLKPCDENLATQLEEGYLRNRPWKQQTGVNPGDAAKSTSGSEDAFSEQSDMSAIAQAEKSTAKDAVKTVKEKLAPGTGQGPLPTHRLFGVYMSHVATYQDATTAWVLSDDFLSKVSGAMLQRFVGGAGTKYIRGYAEAVRKKNPPKESKRPTTPPKPSAQDDKASTAMQRSQSAPGTSSKYPDGPPEDAQDSHDAAAEPETRLQTLERQMSSLVSEGDPKDPDKQDEVARKRQEQEIKDDYRDTSGDAQDREIEHLIFVTHGIGQRMGARFESFNFIHDVNELRKTLKLVYNSSADLQALNGEVDKAQKNCRVQVLPICWRHLLDFPQQGVRHARKEHDIADVPLEDDEAYPSLENITVEGVPALRNIISDLALDILLYQTPAYKDHLSRIVVRECNKTLRLFKKRNPSFKGKVSMIGHSLGSAIMFDILSDQEKELPTFERSQRHTQMPAPDLKLNFDVEDFYCLGSPIGLFQMLKGKTIAGRSNPNKVTLDGYPDSLDDPFTDSPYSKLPGSLHSDAQMEAMTSAPKCAQFYNIFHPSDPIGYRLEPLISSAMTALKPQALPYTKKNFFGAPIGQGFTGIPAKVGQSFTGFWSNFSSGLATSFINRSLGLSAEDAARLNTPAGGVSAQQQASVIAQQRMPQSLGAGTNITAGGVIPNVETIGGEDAQKRKLAEVTANQEQGQKPPTLIDAEMETLYSGFQKRRRSTESDAVVRDLGGSPLWLEAEERGRKLRREEAKVRALNSNGRVDYSIQEGAFDISFLASIASHLAYWTDEDVSHFIMSQLLSRQRQVRSS